MKPSFASVPSPNREGQTSPYPLPQIDSILVATDLSARSDRAIARAAELAATTRARLTVVHVIDDDLPKSVVQHLSVAAKAEIETSLSKLDKARQNDASIHVLTGAADRDIVGTAEAWEADLVVMGVHRNEDGRRPLTGTTLERVVRTGRSPVLVVKDLTDGPYQRALIATDFSVHARRALRVASVIAPDSARHLVHAYHVPFTGLHPSESLRQSVQETHEAELAAFVREELAALIHSALPEDEAGAPLDAQAIAGDVHGVIYGEIQRLEPDLLVLGTHGRTGVAQLMLGSVAAEFMNKPPCDVLAVKAW